MRTHITLVSFWIMVLLVGTSIPEFHARRTIIIEPGAPGTINRVISGDTTTLGERIDPQTVYVLRRDAIYLYTEPIKNFGFPLKVVAEGGDGARPVILGAAVAGVETPRLFNAYDHLTVIGLHFTGFDEWGIYTESAAIRLATDNCRLVVEDCFFTDQRLEVIRLDGKNCSLYFKKNIVRNNFNQLANDTGWGISFNGNPGDTLDFVDNLWFNGVSRLFARWQSLNYVRFGHNTIANMGGILKESEYLDQREYAILDFRQTRTLICRNNLLINPGFAGVGEKFATKMFIFNLDSSIVDPLGISMPPLKVDFRNNNIYLDPLLIAAFPDTVHELKLFDPMLTVLVGNGTSNKITREAIQFNAPPELAPLKKMTQKYYDHSNGTEVMRLDDTDYHELDFRYAADSKAYTGATSGLPLGALFLWGNEINSVMIAPNKCFPEKLQVHGNFPNPFNPVTTICFDLGVRAEIRVFVFNSIGQIVLETVSKPFASTASHQIELNLQNLPSGVYFYKIMARAGKQIFAASDRMVLLR